MRIAILLLTLGSSILLFSQTQSISLSPEFQGVYTAYAWSRDRGMSWSNGTYNAGHFKHHFVDMQFVIMGYDTHLEYKRVSYIKYNGVHYAYIYFLEDDVMTISQMSDKVWLIQYLRGEKETVRYRCTKN